MIKGIFLGTGSIPTKERNSQGVLLEFDNKETVLIDCGEGIQRQILNIDTDLEKLNTIFLTHDHIDHIYGVGGMLTLLLSRYPKKKVIIYGPKVTVKTVKEVVNLFMPEKISRIKYIETTGSQEIRTESYDCYTFKTYHTDWSIGYLFHFRGRKVALFGDVGIPHNRAKESMIRSIKKADVAIIDGVHIPAKESAIIARKANVKKLYLMPILLNKTEEEVLKEVSTIFNNTFVPNDYEEFIVK